MDAQGYFNFGMCNSLTSAAITKAKKVIVEVNENMPLCLGGNQESVHVSRVDYVVEGKNSPILEVPPAPRQSGHPDRPSHHGGDRGRRLPAARHRGLPNVIGAMIAESDLTDLGIHTEMLVDSMVISTNTGKITGNRKTTDRFKMVYTFAMGTRKLYDFLHNNPACASYP